MRVLVVHGSKLGGTKGLAEMVGAAFEHRGADVVLGPAAEVTGIEGFDVVVIGGALYEGRWHQDARRFVERRRHALQDVDVWLFSSGPLDDSAAKRDIPPVAQVEKLIAELDARGHATFGGRLEAKPKGLMARMMAKKLSGDWRDVDQVDAWVEQIVSDVRARATAG
jgi:menaquinone-dependent protoporphyrinogen oxidase